MDRTLSFSIGVVDDDDELREALILALEMQHQARGFRTAGEALAAVADTPLDLILLDLGLPDMSGLEALERLKAIIPDITVIVITASNDVDTAVACMKLGASDFLVKPINMDALEASIRNALEKLRLKKEVQLLQERHLKENVPLFIGESDVIQDVMHFVDKVAKAPDTPVLIVGETGTGKELIAAAIHYKSPNFSGPLITLNCSAIPRDLLESELFGYERGAFTGARRGGKRGLVEEAQGGTLFLDEIADLSLEAQAKLLRFLEEGEFYRIGGTKKITVRTRVVSATNKELEKLIEVGLFREDLYYRLAVIKVEVPSLNQRREDIIPIARHFLAEFSGKHGRAFTGFTPEAERFLQTHRYRGNIRELRNLVERGVLVGTPPVLDLDDLGLRPTGPPMMEAAHSPSMENIRLPAEGIKLEELEAAYIKAAYQQAGGNDAKAAKLLGMNYYSYRYRRKKLGIA